MQGLDNIFLAYSFKVHDFSFPVAPDILAEATSSDTIVKEGEDVLLTCKATGRPEPQIMWRKEDGQSFVVKEGKTKRKGICS